jgi:hypothetical protein
VTAAAPAGDAIVAEALHLCLDREGEWLQGEPAHLKSHKAVALRGRGVRILSADCTGAALLSGTAAPLLNAAPVVGTCDAELYLKLTFASGGFEYLATPVRAPAEFRDVRELELSIHCVVGHQACTAVRYRAFFNAHCLFERL